MRKIIFLLQTFVMALNLSAQYPVLVEDVAAFPSSSHPMEMIAFNDKIIFSAQTGNFGSGDRELFISDGTEEGTFLLMDLVAGRASGYPRLLLEIHGKLYFVVADNSFGPLVYRPWVTDGSVSGTFPLLPTPSSFGGSVIYGVYSMKPEDIFLECNGQVYFTALEDGGNYARQIYQTNGTPEGTVVVMDPNQAMPSAESTLMCLNDSIYFTGLLNNGSSNLYRSSGEVGQFDLVKSGVSYLGNSGHLVFGGKMFFAASSPNNANSYEPWVSDGTENGTFELANLNVGAFLDSDPKAFSVLNEKVVFIARPHQDSTTLYSIDLNALPLAVLPVKQIFNGSFLAYTNTWIFTNSDQSIALFRGTDPVHGDEPWMSDGTEAGTQLLKDIIPGSGGSTAHTFVEYCQEVYFTAGNPTTFVAQSLHKTNYTPEGTLLISGVEANPTSGSGIEDKVVYNNDLLFAGQYDVNIGVELYKFTADCGIGVDEESSSANWLTVFPNPSKGVISLLLPSNKSIAELKIFDANGQLVDSPSPRLANISLENLSKGLYTIRAVTHDGEQGHTRVLIIH